MADSPAKRRKTSPTTFTPIDAPTPSRIPIPSAQKTSARRPSFASPTKASLARHNPQLLNRPTSSGSGSARPATRNLQDVFARALGETPASASRPGSRDANRDASRSESTTQENEPEAMARYASQHLGETTPRQSTKSIGGALSNKPRRLSRSPTKRPERLQNQIPDVDATKDLPSGYNPFQKKGLRRSPISGQAAGSSQQEEQVPLEAVANPFAKTGLRRSPTSSQPVASLGSPRNGAPTIDAVAEISPELPPVAKGGLGRSHVSSRPVASFGLQQHELSTSEPAPDIPPISPFIPRTGLRRSPVLSQPLASPGLPQNEASTTEETPILPPVSPFIPRTGLRRSPVFSQPVASLSPQIEVPATDAHVTEAAPTISPVLPSVKAGLRRSPVSSHRVADLESSQSKVPETEAASTLSPIPPEVVGEAEPISPQIEPPAYISLKQTEPVPTTTNVHEVPRQASPVQPDESQQSDPPHIEDEYIPAFEPVMPPTRPGHQFDNLFHANRPERAEPELPLTPTQRGILDPIVTTPPSGIHNTPSRRARRNKALLGKLKSSPLKPKDPAPEELSKEKQRQVLEDVKEPQPEPVKRRKSARFLIPEDPHAAKKKTRDDLLLELQQLQADVALANQENERLRRAEYKRKRASTASNSEELFAMLTRATASERPVEPKPKPTSMFKSIGAFLPFHPRRRPAPLPVSEKPLPSHLPIALDDPLPYLQAFTPLTYTSTITLLPSNPSASDESSQEKEPVVMQKHFITVSHPSGLFLSRFAMTVDTSTLSISAIDILRLDMNAEKELGTFIRARARDEGPLGKDVTVICWAMSRWVEVSIKRAQFWCAVEKDFGTPEARIASLQRKKKRKRVGSVIGDDEAVDTEERSEKTKWTRKQLLQHFGRNSMELSNDEVELRFEWKIGFDWTGEVESSIAAAARMPKHWVEADERKSLSKVSQTFDKLRNEQGPLGAVRTIVGLLMADS